MPQTGMDWWIIGSVIAALVTALFTYLQLRKSRRPNTRIVQRMINSEDSNQSASSEGVEQTMDGAKRGKQDAS